jgi:CheY-like chemotaxis protein
VKGDIMQPTGTSYPAHRAPRWMVVDDDRHLLEMIKLALQQRFEVEVECFDSPLMALTVLTKAPQDYALALTDFQMPRMNGADFRARVQELAPTLKVYLMTGSGFFTESSAQRLGFEGLLEKPFTPTALRRLLPAHASLSQN